MLAPLGVFWRAGATRRDKRYAFVSIIATTYFMSLTTFVTYLALFEIMPVAFTDNRDAVLYHSLLILYLFLNVVGNFANAHGVDTSVEGLPRDVLRAGRKRWDMWCKTCRMRSPRRAHHCVLCDQCVLKRDHHCFFINTCVGYANQKYFVLFCLYTFIAGLYCTVLQALYLNELYHVPFQGTSTLFTMIPSTLYHWAYVGDVGSYQLFLVVLFYSSFFSGLLSGSFFFWSMYTIYRGQTSFEARVGIDCYSKTWSENLIDTFGRGWFISLFLPLPLPQSGLGLYQDQYEDEEDDSLSEEDTKPVTNGHVNGTTIRKSRSFNNYVNGKRLNNLSCDATRTPSPQLRRVASARTVRKVLRAKMA